MAADDTPAAPDASDVEESATEDGPPSSVDAELVALVAEHLSDDIIDAAENFADYVVRVKPDAWTRAAEVAKEHLDCDYISFVSAIDWSPTPREGGKGAPSAPVQPQEQTTGVAGGEGRFQVFGHLQSTTRHWGLTVKADVADDEPRIDTWVGVYPGADWHERECAEMYGVEFVGHPSLRKLYLPSEFEGYPLRKDFPLLARAVKPWPGLVDVEDMPEPPTENGDDTKSAGAETEAGAP